MRAPIRNFCIMTMLFGALVTTLYAPRDRMAQSRAAGCIRLERPPTTPGHEPSPTAGPPRHQGARPDPRQTRERLRQVDTLLKEIARRNAREIEGAMALQESVRPATATFESSDHDRWVAILRDSKEDEEILAALVGLVSVRTASGDEAPLVVDMYFRTTADEVRKTCLWALGKLGETQFLVGVSRTGWNEELRTQAVLALESAKDTRAAGLALLQALADDSSAVVRENASFSFCRLTRREPELLADLDRRLGGIPESERAALLRALVSADVPRASATLVSVLEGRESQSVREAAARSLRDLQRAAFDPELAKQLEPIARAESAPEVQLDLLECLKPETTGEPEWPQGEADPPASSAQAE